MVVREVWVVMVVRVVIVVREVWVVIVVRVVMGVRMWRCLGTSLESTVPRS